MSDIDPPNGPSFFERIINNDAARNGIATAVAGALIAAVTSQAHHPNTNPSHNHGDDVRFGRLTMVDEYHDGTRLAWRSAGRLTALQTKVKLGCGALCSLPLARGPGWPPNLDHGALGRPSWPCSASAGQHGGRIHGSPAHPKRTGNPAAERSG
jgi:hypothetical protein